MRGKNRKPIASCLKLPQFTTMNVIDGQAGLILYASLIFYSLTIDNILNIIVLLILAGISIATLSRTKWVANSSRWCKDKNRKSRSSRKSKNRYLRISSRKSKWRNYNKAIKRCIEPIFWKCTGRSWIREQIKRRRF